MDQNNYLIEELTQNQEKLVTLKEIKQNDF